MIANRKPWIMAVAAILLAMLPLIVKDTFFLRVLTESIMWIGLAIAWDVLAGYTGYLNFGHGAFFGVGAYVTASLIKFAGMPFLVAMPLGGLAAGVLALISGIPTLRLKGAYFAIATWAMARALQQLALVYNVTGGPDGMRLPAYLHPQFFYYVMLILVAGIFALLWYLLEHAPFGLKVKAIREDEAGAMSLGIHPTSIKIKAYLLSTIPAGLIGGVYAYWITYIDPASVLGDIVTDQAVVMAVFGGLGTLIGPIVGAIIIYFFKTLFWAYLSDYQVLYLIILGVLIAMSVVFLPNGLYGTLTGRTSGKTAIDKGLSIETTGAKKKEADHE
jgi:branched-chain amino acid transport system permease protein